MDMLKQFAATPDPQTEPLETQIYYAFGLFGNVTFEGRTIEQILLDLLEKRGMKKLWGVFEKHLLPDSSLEPLWIPLERSERRILPPSSRSWGSPVRVLGHLDCEKRLKK